MYDAVPEQSLETFYDIQHVRDCFGLDKLPFLLYFVLEVSVFAKLCHYKDRVLLIKLRFYLDNVYLLSQFPVDIELVCKHLLLLWLIQDCLVNDFNCHFLVYTSKFNLTCCLVYTSVDDWWEPSRKDLLFVRIIVKFRHKNKWFI